MASAAGSSSAASGANEYLEKGTKPGTKQLEPSLAIPSNTQIPSNHVMDEFRWI